MAFPVPVASVLTGATRAQLAYWRRDTSSAPALLVPAGKRGGRYLYSWADIVALRSIVYLRSEKSLPRIRRAVATLRRLEADEWHHLAQYTLISTRKSILVRTPKGDLLDVGERPGTVLSEVLMRDVLAPFQTGTGQMVPALKRPRPHITVDPRVLGGYPVLAGTRVPYDAVAALANDALAPAEISAIYPSIEHEGIQDAMAFAEQVAAVA